MEIILFFVLFGLMLFLQRWLQQHIQGLTYAVTGNPGCAVRALFLVLLPGVVLHEFSHWLVANLVGVRTGRVSIGLGKMRGKHFSLGSVTVEKSDPLRESLIGVAPFIFGILAVWALMGLGFGLWSPQSVSQVLETLGAVIRDPLTWVALYFVFAVSTSMIPSESDREPWGVIIAIFAGIGLLALVLGWSPNITPELLQWGQQVLSTLIFVFGIIVVVNGTLAILIFLFEWGFGTVTSRRVRY
ncbi:MAG: RIP metalloprotease [Chloroflexota bacterium]|nr:MAG: RIP metalloprotease [Chloroflexota bacterium]